MSSLFLHTNGGYNSQQVKETRSLHKSIHTWVIIIISIADDNSRENALNCGLDLLIVPGLGFTKVREQLKQSLNGIFKSYMFLSHL